MDNYVLMQVHANHTYALATKTAINQQPNNISLKVNEYISKKQALNQTYVLALHSRNVKPVDKTSHAP